MYVRMMLSAEDAGVASTRQENTSLTSGVNAFISPVVMLRQIVRVNRSGFQNVILPLIWSERGPAPSAVCIELMTPNDEVPRVSPGTP